MLIDWDIASPDPRPRGPGSHPCRLRVAAALSLGALLIAPSTAQSTDTTPRQSWVQMLNREALLYSTPGQSWRYLPGDECSRWTYLGRASKSQTNGRDRWSVKSRLSKTAWFTYRTAKAEGLVNGSCPS